VLADGKAHFRPEDLVALADLLAAVRAEEGADEV
jgi:hypothetical protein